IFAGVRSVTQMRVAANPGRAGSVRTSGDGPSAITFDFSPSSLTTILRTGAGALLITVHRSLLCSPFTEFGAHHDECHLAALVGISPCVPAADLHDHVTWLERALAIVRHQDTRPGSQNAVVERLGLVYARGVEILAAAL